MPRQGNRSRAAREEGDPASGPARRMSVYARCRGQKGGGRVSAARSWADAVADRVAARRARVTEVGRMMCGGSDGRQREMRGRGRG